MIDSRPGYMLLSLLGLGGWTVGVTRAFGGGVLVLASKGPYEVRRQGKSVADIAPEVFEEAARLARLPATDLQLELV